MRKLVSPKVRYLLLLIPAIAVIVIVLLSLRAIDLRSAEEKQIDNGRELSYIYCKSCHQYPDPSLIDKHTWVSGVLPGMAKQFKLEYFSGRYGVTSLSKIAPGDF